MKIAELQYNVHFFFYATNPPPRPLSGIPDTGLSAKEGTSILTLKDDFNLTFDRRRFFLMVDT